MARTKKVSADTDQELPYEVDSRPLCQGMRFVLTDAAHPRKVLKHGSHFLVLDAAGMIPACNTLGYGYYRDDTRYISQWEMALDDAPISLLSSRIEDGFSATLFYTNPQTANLQQQRITLLREVVLGDALYERITLENFHSEEVEFDLTISLQSDFADMFEVRGLNLSQRGERMVPLSGKDGRCLSLAYKGLDGLLQETVIDIDASGAQRASLQDGRFTIRFRLPVRQSRSISLKVLTRLNGKTAHVSHDEVDYASALKLATNRYLNWCKSVVDIQTCQELFDVSLNRSLKDIYILRQPTPKGIGLAAGIPWYCAVFGRDSAITALQLLPFAPELARETIEVLAAYQGQKDDLYKAEHPGRIMHELRLGELARRAEIPHNPYYGTVDATQLWLILYGQYVSWSGDIEFARRLWGSVYLALDWLDRASGSGYITYQRESPHGLENQGWKDSGDSVMHRDGRLANPPIALCEAQAYLYQAWQEVASVAVLLGKSEIADSLVVKARSLKDRFQRDFWMSDENFLALALDRDGCQVGSISSNPGHCLASGILDEDKAHLVADRLMSLELHTSWGIRTLSSGASSFNPISYHNGSIWPHDNSMITEGLRKVGRVEDVHSIMRELFEVMLLQPDFRLPELFCGFDKIDAAAPINYPVSCSPQAWAAGSIFQLLKVCLNFEPDAARGILRVREPALPDWLDTITLTGLRVGAASVDVKVTSQAGSTSCQILRKEGNLRVIIEC